MADRSLYRPSWAAKTSMFLHVVWAIVVGYIIFVGPSGRVVSWNGIDVWVPRCLTCDQASDAVATASEMGRLDLVALSLTVLGVVLAVAAFGSYFVIRSAAMDAARDEVRDQAPTLVKKVVGRQLIVEALRENPQVILSAVRQVVREVGTEEVSPEEADAIASAVDEDSDEQT